MNLVIFSPLTLSSAIGRVTDLVVSALADQGHVVTIVRSEDGSQLSPPARSIDVPVLRWNDESGVLAAAAAADGVVYQVGDNYDFHRGCLEWMPKLPGIVCLHEYFVGSLFRRWARPHQREAEAILRLWYGDVVARRYFSLHEPAVFVERTAAEAPMTEWVASMAHAVVTHSNWGIARVLASCPGPVRVVPLPYDAPAILQQGRRSAADRDDGLAILTIGNVNANKRVGSVIRAIGESEQLRSVATYRLVGRIDPAMAEELQALAEQLEVRLVILGEIPDDDLRVAIDASDVVCALRMPALEAASASTIEAMLYGKPVVVMETGFYQELPDEYVRKISPEREVDDLRRVLEELQADPAQRRAIGTAAAAWAARTFRADTYATNLVDLVVDVAAAAPALAATRYFAETLVSWGGSGRLTRTGNVVEALRIMER